ncbi:TetR family transcriptional regulator [Gordonia sp. SID5947]|uniref:TetR/AcrR family transcriptional regulator n=1 Tax=Gordonia sp. SID5947 TaxID=2690315 RepID=UPI001369298A|nr:TetR family transcriptional regulator [Gordonia sp. SID5947]MYR06632.1 TetR family transcriptional regulator [Gordonia sp. SID5947]
MQSGDFRRARSPQAKQAREEAILSAARELATQRGIREITLTDIAVAVGMHKSAMLRYFETREEIFLRLTADGWREWSAALRADLDARHHADAEIVASVIGATLATRGQFCDLLAQAPMNLERNVSPDAVRRFKYVTHAELDAIVESVRRLLPALSVENGVDLIATSTALAGAFWQIATPGPEILELYRDDPRLGHALVDVESRLRRILAALITGLLAD